MHPQLIELLAHDHRDDLYGDAVHPIGSGRLANGLRRYLQHARQAEQSQVRRTGGRARRA